MKPNVLDTRRNILALIWFPSTLFSQTIDTRLFLLQTGLSSHIQISVEKLMNSNLKIKNKLADIKN